MKRKSFYKHWWVHLLGFVMLLLTVFILNKKLSFFQFNKTNSANLEHKTATETEVQAAMMNNMARQVKDLGTAEELFKRSLEHIPTNEKYKVLYNFGVAYANHEEHEKAIQEFSAAIKLNSNCYDCFVSRALSYDKLFELKLAMNDYDEAIHINPKNLRAYLAKAGSYNKIHNDYLNSKKNFLKCIEINNKYYDAYLGLIYLNLIFGFVDDAQSVLKELKNNTSNEIELISAYLIAQAVIYAYIKDVENFFKTLNKFIATDSNEKLFLNKTVDFSYVSPVLDYAITTNVRMKNFSEALKLITYTIQIAENRNIFDYVEKLNKDKLLVEKLLKNEIPNFEYKKGMLAISE